MPEKTIQSETVSKGAVKETKEASKGKDGPVENTCEESDALKAALPKRVKYIGRLEADDVWREEVNQARFFTQGTLEGRSRWRILAKDAMSTRTPSVCQVRLTVSESQCGCEAK